MPQQDSGSAARRPCCSTSRTSTSAAARSGSCMCGSARLPGPRGPRPRWVPMLDGLDLQLRWFLDDVHGRFPGSAALFCDESGGQLATGTVRNRLRHLMKLEGRPAADWFTPHSLRPSRDHRRHRGEGAGRAGRRPARLRGHRGHPGRGERHPGPVGCWALARRSLARHGLQESRPDPPDFPAAADTGPRAQDALSGYLVQLPGLAASRGTGSWPGDGPGRSGSGRNAPGPGCRPACRSGRTC
jgi:hypothetical protein